MASRVKLGVQRRLLALRGLHAELGSRGIIDGRVCETRSVYCISGFTLMSERDSFEKLGGLEMLHTSTGSWIRTEMYNSVGRTRS